MESKKTYRVLTVLLIMQWAFIQIIAQYPHFIEKYYSNGLYIYISKLLRILSGWIPFSIGDLLYVLLIGYLLIRIYVIIKTKKIVWKDTLFKIGGFAAIIYFLFHLNWGLNYFRLPLHSTLHIENKPYTVEELFEFTNSLIVKSNAMQLSIAKNDTIMVDNNLDKNEIKVGSHRAYEQLQSKYPQFTYIKPAVKHSLFSLPLTYMGFAGYLNPITNEAQVNYLIPKNSYPATLCHEIAHQTGIASESEANFVGYLAAIHADDHYFKYSGYVMALKYCLFELYRKDPDKFELLKAKLNKGILKDIQHSQNFWKSYQNWSEKYFKSFYDSFLKANKQKDGIKGYNKMVVLLINYYKKQPL
jgi:hypothetical protein